MRGRGGGGVGVAERKRKRAGGQERDKTRAEFVSTVPFGLTLLYLHCTTIAGDLAATKTDSFANNPKSLRSLPRDAGLAAAASKGTAEERTLAGGCIKS